LYIKLFEMYVRIGGDVSLIQTRSPIETVVDQLLRLNSKEIGDKKTIWSESTVSPSPQKTPKQQKRDVKITGLSQEGSHVVNHLILRRRQMIQFLEIAELIVKREEMKRDVVQKCLD